MNPFAGMVDVAVGGLWKLVACALLLALAASGGGWWLAAHDRDIARADLAAERTVSDQLRTAIREQNRAVDALARSDRFEDEIRRVPAASGYAIARLAVGEWESVVV